MPRSRLTDALVAKLPVSSTRTYHWDTDVPKLAVLVLPSGHKSWIVQWHRDGRDIRVTLGSPPVMQVKEARRKAVEAMAAASTPTTSGEVRKPSVTFLEASRAYCQERLAGRATEKKTPQMLARTIPAWLNAKAVTDLTMDDLKKVHAEVTPIRGPAQANNMASVIRSVLGFCQEKGWVPHSPFSGLKMDLNPAKRRKKALTRDQYARVFKVIREKQAATDSIQWLALEAIVLTGGRKMEMLSLREDEVDLDRMVITKAHHKTERKVGVKELPITPQLRDCIERARAWKQRKAQDTIEITTAQRIGTSPWIFPAPGRRDSREGHLVVVEYAWEELKAEAGLPEEFVIHNFRSALVSMAMAQGADVAVVAKLVGHSDVQTTLKHYREVTRDELERGRNVVADFFNSL